MYRLERMIEHLTTYVRNAKAEGRMHIHPDVREVEEIISLLAEKTKAGGEPVKPFPNETLNKLGWSGMENCGACGNQLRTNANFCDVCGRAVKRE